MERGMRREMTGVVVSDKMEKTCVVAIEAWKVVPKYGKRVRSTQRVKAHDEEKAAGVGDVVRIVECRPFSRDKKWRVVEVVEKSKDAGGDPA